jgi:hypothetical protein
MCGCCRWSVRARAAAAAATTAARLHGPAPVVEKAFSVKCDKTGSMEETLRWGSCGRVTGQKWYNLAVGQEGHVTHQKAVKTAHIKAKSKDLRAEGQKRVCLSSVICTPRNGCSAAQVRPRARAPAGAHLLPLQPTGPHKLEAACQTKHARRIISACKSQFEVRYAINSRDDDAMYRHAVNRGQHVRFRAAIQ